MQKQTEGVRGSVRQCKASSLSVSDSLSVVLSAIVVAVTGSRETVTDRQQRDNTAAEGSAALLDTAINTMLGSTVNVSKQLCRKRP